MTWLLSPYPSASRVDVKASSQGSLDALVVACCAITHTSRTVATAVACIMQGIEAIFFCTLFMEMPLIHHGAFHLKTVQRVKLFLCRSYVEINGQKLVPC